MRHTAMPYQAPVSLLRKAVMRGCRILGVALGSRHGFRAVPTRAVLRAEVPKVALSLLCLQAVWQHRSTGVCLNATWNSTRRSTEPYRGPRASC